MGPLHNNLQTPPLPGEITERMMFMSNHKRLETKFPCAVSALFSKESPMGVEGDHGTDRREPAQRLWLGQDNKHVV